MKNLETKFRIGMAKILGSEGKFAMNSMVNLVTELLKVQREELIKKVEELLHDKFRFWLDNQTLLTVINLLRKRKE
jgi:hypothetical protein